MPQDLALALATTAALAGDVAAVIVTLLSHDCWLRISEVAGLTVDDVVDLRAVADPVLRSVSVYLPVTNFTTATLLWRFTTTPLTRRRRCSDSTSTLRTRSSRSAGGRRSRRSRRTYIIETSQDSCGTTFQMRWLLRKPRPRPSAKIIPIQKRQWRITIGGAGFPDGVRPSRRLSKP